MKSILSITWGCLLFGFTPPYSIAAETIASPSGKIVFKQIQNLYLPYDFPEDGDIPICTFALEEVNSPPFTIVLPDGRLMLAWSAEEKLLALGNQMDRANFQLSIIRMADRKTLICDFSKISEQMADMVRDKHPESLSGPSQLSNLNCTATECTGRITQPFAVIDFKIDFDAAKFSPAGTPILPSVAKAQLIE